MKQTNEAIPMNAQLNASLMDEINYILSKLREISDRVKEIKQKHSNPKSIKFWVSAIFDSKLRELVADIIHFDYDYTIESTEKRVLAANGGEHKELSGRIQESSPTQS